MKYEIYRCDECDSILSDPSQNIAKKHLSMNFSDPSGWAYKHDTNNHWYHESNSARGIKQFCGALCLAGYFESKSVT